LDFKAVNTQCISAGWLTDKKISLDILRLDKIDAIVSGNKYFKLKYYLQNAIAANKKVIATFGGAWSNHIVATAFACNELGLKSIGFIRGEKPAVLSATLIAAESYGMELRFVTREEYRNKDLIKIKHFSEDWYGINEGGFGATGAKGAAEILRLANHNTYTHIVAAVGTGTMMAGLVISASANQKIIGISSMKGNNSLEAEIKSLSESAASDSSFQLFHNYHFGGYGKHPKDLLDYINKIYLLHNLPLDIIYTGKTFYAIEDLAKQDFFPAESKILMIHSGGLQGNRSLPPEVLAF
jgi:1-aminocyclopropane-1-carboxylate deaminase/D-cysteine desulfhydrase-like pyridoxal-dependent ACC family enzyme